MSTLVTEKFTGGIYTATTLMSHKTSVKQDTERVQSKAALSSR